MNQRGVIGDGMSGTLAFLFEIDELELDLFFLLTIAGSETTRDAITQGVIALVEHPEHLETLRGAATMPGSAVEEILRWSSPVSYFARRATGDTMIRGVPVGAGQRITLWYPSANRDEDVFDEELLQHTRRIEIPGPPVYGALGIYNPIPIAPKELAVRLS